MRYGAWVSCFKTIVAKLWLASFACSYKGFNLFKAAIIQMLIQRILIHVAPFFRHGHQTPQFFWKIIFVHFNPRKLDI